MKKNILIYDCEIAKCIPDHYGYNSSRYQYCKGWHDFAGMGVAVVGCWTEERGYEVFLECELDKFQKLVDRADEIVGFNSLSFDDNLMKANGVNVQTTYDLLAAVRVAAGMPPHYVRGVTRAGYSLNDLAGRNLGEAKTSTGGEAPKLWQRGKYEQVIDYCLNDVRLLKTLYDRRACLLDPARYDEVLLRCPGTTKLQFYRQLAKLRWQQFQEAKGEYIEKWKPFLWAVRHGQDISRCTITLPLHVEIYRRRNARLGNGLWELAQITVSGGLPQVRYPTHLRDCYYEAIGRRDPTLDYGDEDKDDEYDDYDDEDEDTPF